MQDELGVIWAGQRQQQARQPKPEPVEQDLVIVSKGTSRPGRVFIGSVRTNSIVGEVDVEIIKGNVVVTVRRCDESYFGPVSLVVV